MTKKYGKWNEAKFYPNCQTINSSDQEYCTEKMLYGENAEVKIKYCYNTEEYNIDAYEHEILLRIAASHGITKNQLIKYLKLQGKIFHSGKFESCMEKLEKYGYIVNIKIAGLDDNGSIIVYDLAERGTEHLKNKELPHYSSLKEYSDGNILRLLRVKITSNQILLQLLCNYKDLKSFFFDREFIIPGAGNVLFPLYIQTTENNYAFKFVDNTKAGKNRFEEQMEILLKDNSTVLDDTILVIVAETYEHLERLYTLAMNYKKRGLKREILFTNDSDWYRALPGNFYGMAVISVLGQSSMMNIKLV